MKSYERLAPPCRRAASAISIAPDEPPALRARPILTAVRSIFGLLFVGLLLVLLARSVIDSEIQRRYPELSNDSPPDQFSLASLE